MTDKTTQLEHQLLQDIVLGKYPAGSKIPSRHWLCSRWNCSRTVVERAVNRLIQAGYLVGVQGSGTFVASRSPEPGTPRRVLVISTLDRNNNPTVALNESQLGLPVEWVRRDDAEHQIARLCAPGTAVIWQMPGFQDLSLLNYLRGKNVPLLLLNRNFSGFDCICTDPDSSIREGLSWLMIESGREIGFVARTPSDVIPFQAERIIAFYQSCVELGAELQVQWCCCRPFHDVPREMAAAGLHLFDRSRRPGGIFVLNWELALPLVMYAQSSGLHPGKDYKLLSFDPVPELTAYPGVGMLCQNYGLFAREIRRWLENLPAATPFCSLLKTDLNYRRR